jgi:hypothetical protein
LGLAICLNLNAQTAAGEAFMIQDWRNCYCNPPGCQYVNFDEDEVVADCKSRIPVGRRQEPVTAPGTFGLPLPADAWSQRCIDDAADDARREALMRSVRSS